MTLLFRVHKYRVDDLSDCFRRFAKFTRQISQTRLNFDSARKNSLSDAEFLNPTRSETLKKKKKMSTLALIILGFIRCFIQFLVFYPPENRARLLRVSTVHFNLLYFFDSNTCVCVVHITVTTIMLYEA